jgi:hypothetical protein
MRLCALALPLLIAACGGADRAGEATPTPAPAAEPAPAEAGHHEHAGPPELSAFHEVLAPRWHAEAGPGRMKDTCGAIAEFRTRAGAVKAAAAPAGVDAGKWSDAGGALEQSVTRLESACAGDQASFDAAFGQVHEAFHAAMELAMSGGEHGHEHEAGHEHGE